MENKGYADFWGANKVYYEECEMVNCLYGSPLNFLPRASSRITCIELFALFLDENR